MAWHGARLRAEVGEGGAAWGPVPREDIGAGRSIQAQEGPASEPHLALQRSRPAAKSLMKRAALWLPRPLGPGRRSLTLTGSGCPLGRKRDERRIPLPLPFPNAPIHRQAEGGVPREVLSLDSVSTPSSPDSRPDLWMPSELSGLEWPLCTPASHNPQPLAPPWTLLWPVCTKPGYRISQWAET